MYYIADAHCDFLYGAMEYGYRLKTRTRNQSIHLDGLQKGHVALQLFACWYDSKLKTSPSQQCFTMIDCFYRMLEENPELVPFSPTFDPASGKTAALLTVEGGEACEGSLSMLRIFKRLGVGAMTFTWNENNELGGAAMARRQKGLTALGKEMLREMNRIGVAMDVSHLSDAGILDALSYSDAPVFASHSNARSVCGSARCLPDEMIREIALQGGVIGVNFYSPQLVEKGRAHMEDIVRHIMHIVSVGGIDCCCFGSDFDGMGTYPPGLEDSSGFPRLCELLRQAGFSREETEKIAYWNLHQYLSRFV